MNRIIGRIRYHFINKPRHKKKKRRQEPARVPYIGPQEYLYMKSSGVMS